MTNTAGELEAESMYINKSLSYLEQVVVCIHIVYIYTYTYIIYIYTYMYIACYSPNGAPPAQNPSGHIHSCLFP